jgi:hypothetical protein
MRELPTAFRSGSFDYFKLLVRDGDIALLRKTKPGLAFESFEVVMIQRHETFEIKGKLIPAGEHLPRSEQWGIKGWTYSDRLSADRTFNQLISASAFFEQLGAPPRTNGLIKENWSVRDEKRKKLLRLRKRGQEGSQPERVGGLR